MDTARMLGWRVAHARRVFDAKRKRWHTALAGDQGFPDLVLVRGERVVFAELKAGTGRLEPDQAAWLEALELAGVEAYVWRDEDAQAVLDTLNRRTRPMRDDKIDGPAPSAERSSEPARRIRLVRRADA